MALKGNENSAIVAVFLLPFFEEIIESQESNFPPTDNM